MFVLFDASWIGWYHKTDSAMNDIAVRKFFPANYVIRHMVLYVSKGKEIIEITGALDLLKRYKGDEQGIAHWFVFEKTEIYWPILNCVLNLVE
ncbi:MAG: hypothetical protein ACXWWC_07465 [Chitinophagaceae bacterium]